MALTPTMQLRNRLGTLILKNAPQEDIAAARAALAEAVLQAQIREAIKRGVTPMEITYLVKQIALGDAE